MTSAFSLIPAETCIDCHFLRRTNPDSVDKEQVGSRERSILLNQFPTALAAAASNNIHYGCYFGVWDEHLMRSSFEPLTKINREDQCFFSKARPGMIFEAAETLQKSEANNLGASEDRRLTNKVWIELFKMYMALK